MLSRRLKNAGTFHSEANMPSRRFKKKHKVVILIVALATILSLWYDLDVTRGLSISMISRNLSINLGNGECEWVPAIQYTDAGFPTNENLTKTIIAGKFSFLNFMMYYYDITLGLLTNCCLAH